MPAAHPHPQGKGLPPLKKGGSSGRQQPRLRSWRWGSWPRNGALGGCHQCLLHCPPTFPLHSRLHIAPNTTLPKCKCDDALPLPGNLPRSSVRPCVGSKASQQQAPTQPPTHSPSVRPCQSSTSPRGALFVILCVCHAKSCPRDVTWAASLPGSPAISLMGQHLGLSFS